MGPPGLPGKRGQRVGHCVFGLGVLAVLCFLRVGAGGSLLCVALSCLRGIMCPFLALAPLGEVCLRVPACRRWGTGGRQGSMRCLGCSLVLGTAKDSAPSFGSRNNTLNRDSVI